MEGVEYQDLNISSSLTTPLVYNDEEVTESTTRNWVLDIRRR